MDIKTTIRIFDLMSFVCLFAGIVLYVVAKSLHLNVFFWLILSIALALFFRILGLQSRNKELKKENEELRKDLKNLAKILEGKN